MVKHSWLAKNCENCRSFPLQIFYRIWYVTLYAEAYCLWEAGKLKRFQITVIFESLTVMNILINLSTVLYQIFKTSGQQTTISFVVALYA